MAGPALQARQARRLRGPARSFADLTLRCKYFTCIAALSGVSIVVAAVAIVFLYRMVGLHDDDPRMLQTAHTAKAVLVTILVVTLVAAVALGVWVSYLTSPSRTVGLVALLLWWIEVLLGILILLRWLPSSAGGSHADDAKDDSWADGPALSILGHVGMLLGIGFFTWVVLADRLV